MRNLKTRLERCNGESDGCSRLAVFVHLASNDGVGGNLFRVIFFVEYLVGMDDVNRIVKMCKWRSISMYM